MAIAMALAILAGACTSDGEGDDASSAPLSTAPGFDGERFTVGSFSPADGLGEPIGEPLSAGNRVYWEQLNAEGGIAGRYPVDLEVTDTHLVVSESVTVIRYDEIEADLAMVNGLMPAAATRAVLPRLQRDDLVAAPTTEDSDWVHEPNLLPISAPYPMQAINGIAYWLEEEAGPERQLCLLQQEDTYGYGEGALEGVTAASEALGIPIASVATMTTIETDFTEPLDQFEAAGCDAVVYAVTLIHTVPLMTQASRRNFAARWIALPYGWLPSMATEPAIQDYLAEHFWLMGDGPAWGDRSVPGMAQMLDAAERYAPDQEPSRYFVTGYLQSWTLHQVLEQAVASGDVSREGILAAVNEVGTFGYEGLASDYVYGSDALERQPPDASTIFAVDPSAPGGLTVEAQNYASEPAKEFAVGF